MHYLLMELTLAFDILINHRIVFELHQYVCINHLYLAEFLDWAVS